MYVVKYVDNRFDGATTILLLGHRHRVCSEVDLVLDHKCVVTTEGQTAGQWGWVVVT